MTRLDPRSPWVLDTRELQRRPGAMRELTREVEAPEGGFGTDVAAVPAGRPVDLDVRMESVMEGVLVSGDAATTATGACVRCLDDVTIPLDVPFQELFVYPDRAAHHQEVGTDEDEDEQHVLEGDLVDLEPVVRDAIVPALPFQPVCSPDCPGLCSECGAHLKDDPEHHHENIDPRLAALSALLPEGTDNEEKRN